MSKWAKRHTKLDTSRLTWPSTHVRDDNGWSYVVRIGDDVLFSHGFRTRTVLDRITSCKAFIYALEIFAQLMATLSLAERLPTSWLAFIDNTAGGSTPQRLGKDAFVNGMLAVFWGTAARRGWRPRFTRVESKANVADAVSRGDLTRARREKWTRLDDHTDAIIGILVKAAGDADYAAGQAVDDLCYAIKIGGRGRRACVLSAPCPVPPSFGGGTSDHAREAHPRIQKTFR